MTPDQCFTLSRWEETFSLELKRMPLLCQGGEFACRRYYVCPSVSSLDSRYYGNYGGVYSSRGLGIQALHSNGEGEVLCAHERTKPESRFSRSSQQWRWVCLARPA